MENKTGTTSAKLPYVRPDATFVSLSPERNLLARFSKEHLMIPCRKQKTT